MWKERLVLIGDLLLVIMVTFGALIFTSVYPLFCGPNDSSTYSRLYYLFDVVPCLALLVYVLFPISNSSQGQNSDCANAGQFTATPRSLVLKLMSLLRSRIGGLLLISLIGLERFVSYWLPAWLAHFTYSAGSARNLQHLNEIVWEVTSLWVLAYVLSRRGRTFSDIGLTWDTGAVAFALPLFLSDVVLSSILGPITYWLGRTFSSPDWSSPNIGALIFGSQAQIVAAPAGLLNGFREELIVRAFLMTVIIGVTKRSWPAVLASVAVQTSYHFYQGVPVALSYIPLFTLYSVFYAKTRSILPVALAHSLQDLCALWFYAL